VQILLRWGFTRCLEGPIKIGSTGNFEKRFKELAGMHYEYLRPLRVVKSCVASEIETHRRFEDHRLRRDREWFAPTGELMAYIELLAPHEVHHDYAVPYGSHGSPTPNWTVKTVFCRACRCSIRFYREPNCLGDGKVECPVCGHYGGWKISELWKTHGSWEGAFSRLALAEKLHGIVIE